MRSLARKDTLGRPSGSAVALLRLLTLENRALLAIVRDRKPQSVAELAQLAGRAQPNLTRTLGKLASVGLVELRVGRRRKTPLATARRFRILVDPCCAGDKILWD